MLLDWLRLGGVPMWLLMALSIAAATIGIVRLWELWEWRYARLADDWRRQRADLAIAQLGRERSPLAAVLATAIAALNDDALSEAQARERTEQAAAAVLERMRSGFRSLEMIAMLAPLLGLFGTALGLIEALRSLQQAGDTLQPGAIWPALLTTAVGLGIAIPVVVVLHALDRIVERQRQALEAALTQLFTQPRLVRRHAA